MESGRLQSVGYMRHHSHYMCPHTHYIDNITCILVMTSHSPYMWHFFHYAGHHILTLWPQTTVSISSHPLFLTSCPLCVDMSSHPLYWWFHTNCISEITSAKIHEIISISWEETEVPSIPVAGVGSPPATLAAAPACCCLRFSALSLAGWSPPRDALMELVLGAAGWPRGIAAPPPPGNR